MTKGVAEGAIRKALNELDLDIIVYKPPDDARNWKPADFLVWWDPPDPIELLVHPQSAWIEVKECKALNIWNISDLRPSQHSAIVRAAEIGLDYWLAIYWPRRRWWTLCNAIRVVRSGQRQFRFAELASVYGVDATPRMLAPTLRLLLQGETD